MQPAFRFLRIGLTGGIAAGKSTVAELWRAQGAAIIDTDALAHAALAPGTLTHAAIIAAFGTGIRAADGTIHRPALADIVFGNEAQRQVLNGIIHPVVRRGWQETLAQWEREQQTPVAVVMVPLLYEVGVEKEFDVVVVVACSATTQLARLTGKGLTAAQARARIAAQWPVTKKMDRADYVIWNDGSQRVLAEQSVQVWKQIKER
jgi:dephospho-CoA kinase